jgi:hypothetical protein
MKLLPRVFFTIDEAAARLGYAPADIAGWAHQGLLEIVTGIGPVECQGEHAAGLVAISVADLLPMFRRSGSGPRELSLRRIRPQGQETWMLITTPAEGVVVSVDDLLIHAEEVYRFEIEHEIFGKAHKGKGPEPKFDWENFWRAVATLIHEKGVPARLTDFVNEMSDWFMDQSDGKKCPSNSMIRKKLSPLLNRLREQD